MIMRANQLAEAIIDRKPHLTAMKLQKLLYYVEAWHLAVTNSPLFNDDVFRAYADGPVVEDVWRQRKDPGSRSKAGDVPELTPTAEAILDLVMSEYGGRTGDELSALTHTEKPWVDARGNLPEGARSRNEISNESIARFFRDHRQLGGRTAADLAAGGVYALPAAGPLDLGDLLEGLDDVDEEMPSGYQANLHVGRPTPHQGDTHPARHDDDWYTAW
jgi:uncharacterized phage-associated protein